MNPVASIEVERDLLGGILLDSESFGDVLEILSGPDFYVAANARAFEAMAALHRAGRQIDRLSLGDALAKRGDLEAVGGEDFLDELDQVVPVVARLTFYAAMVANFALRRRLIAAGEKIAALGRAWNEGDRAMADEAEHIVKQARRSSAGEVHHVR